MDPKRNVGGGSLRNRREVPGLTTTQWGMAFRPLKDPGRVQQDAGHDPQRWGRRQPEALGAVPFSVPKGRCQGDRPSVASGGPSSALPGPLSRPLFPPPCSSSPKQPPLHSTCASGTAVSPLAQPFPELPRPRRLQKGGREKPWPGPHRLRALTNQNLTGGAERKTRSNDQPPDPRGTGTIGKPGADFSSGSTPRLLLPPPSYSPPNSPVR